MGGMSGNWIGVGILAAISGYFVVVFILCPNCPPVGFPLFVAAVFGFITFAAVRATLRKQPLAALFPPATVGSMEHKRPTIEAVILLVLCVCLAFLVLLFPNLYVLLTWSRQP